MISRYTLPEMGKIWEDEFKFATWLKIEVLACEARAEMGEIPSEDLKEIKEKSAFDVKKILEIEETTKHDVIAFLTNVAEYVGPASRHIHYGMTSSDILDTTLAYQMKTAGELILSQLVELKEVLKSRAVEHKNTICIGRSHGIHAEPTTMGLKFALWYEETKRNIKRLVNAIDTISVGQISGAVGTFDHLSPKVEEYVCKKMGLKPAPVSTQVIQRDRHAEFMATLAVIGSTLEKISIEIRRITGLSRILRANSIAAFENVALWHERDISHSSVERIIIPDSCIALNYAMDLMIKLINNLIIYPNNMIRNLNLTRGLVYSQTVLLKLVDKGLTREEAYKVVQTAAMEVWANQEKNLKDELLKSEEVLKHLRESELNEIFNSSKILKNVDYIFKRTVLAED